MRRTRWALLAAGAIAVQSACDAGPEVPRVASDVEVARACSGCHATPAPEVLPRALWRTQIEHMATLLTRVPRLDGSAATPFDVDPIVAWYEARAPERFSLPNRITRDGDPPLRFRRRRVLLGEGSGPGVATVAALPGSFRPNQLAAPNMSTGSVHLFSLRGGPLRAHDAAHPARVAHGDLDGDGLDDLVVSDLGEAMPSDAKAGRVIALRRRGDGRFEASTLLEGVGRVADAQPLDLDGDGDLDVVVGAFGWIESGGIHLLRNETRTAGALAFRHEVVTRRPGAVRVVPTRDLLPGAGPGFAVAFSQHFETVSAFHETEDGFRERTLYRAPHPVQGTSDLEPADLDGDGDLDFLLASGDTLDDGYAFKPYHGVQWLENLGDAFEAHPIGTLYGAHGAAAADLDGDGDLDVVACGFLPQVALPIPPSLQAVDSLVWFERDGDAWIPWAVERNHPRHTGLAVLDLDEDGRLDIVAAINQAWDLEPVTTGPSLEVWFNEGRTDR